PASREGGPAAAPAPPAARPGWPQGPQHYHQASAPRPTPSDLAVLVEGPRTASDTHPSPTLAFSQKTTTRSSARYQTHPGRTRGHPPPVAAITGGCPRVLGGRPGVLGRPPPGLPGAPPVT